MIRTYYELTKPGIVYGNAMTAIAAFIFAAHGSFNVLLFVATVLGLSLSIAAACVVNNVIDRDIDPHMERTKDRAIPTGRVSIRNALIFAVILGIIGAGLLITYTNLYAFFVTAFGVIVYLAFYTPLKRTTSHSTIIGAFSGAVPPVVGYVAVINGIDSIAVLLFIILVCWQMVHFFAIAIFRVDEYRKAKLPIMTVHAGIVRTKFLMVVYAGLFSCSILTFVLVVHPNLLFTIPMGLISLIWFVLSLNGFRAPNEIRWARMMFFYSLFVLVVFSVLLALS
jgi:protoheme IX farnesyltransferase